MSCDKFCIFFVLFGMFTSTLSSILDTPNHGTHYPKSSREELILKKLIAPLGFMCCGYRILFIIDFSGFWTGRIHNSGNNYTIFFKKNTSFWNAIFHGSSLGLKVKSLGPWREKSFFYTFSQLAFHREILTMAVHVFFNSDFLQSFRR